MAINSFTYNLDEILTHSLLAWRNEGKFYDNIFKTNPTMWYLHASGRREDWRGGERIMINLQYGKNSTIKSYSRYGKIDTSPQDNQTAAFYNMKQLGGAITIDRFSMRQNSGKYAIQSLAKSKFGEAEMSMAEEINTQLWAASAATLDISTIPELISRDGLGTIGNINASLNTWWKNKFKIDVDIDTKVEIKQWMRNMYNNCSKGAAKMKKGDFVGNSPDLLIAGQAAYEGYEASLDANSRYVNNWAQKAISCGFEAVKFKNAIMMWDEMCGDAYSNTFYPTANTTDSIYFLNTNFINYYVDVETDLLVGKFQEPIDQDIRTAKIIHYHQLTVSNRAKQGVLGFIDLTEIPGA